MQREFDVPQCCQVCSAKVENKRTKSLMTGEEIIVTVCDNRHMYENTISSLIWKTAILKKNLDNKILYKIWD